MQEALILTGTSKDRCERWEWAGLPGVSHGKTAQVLGVMAEFELPNDRFLMQEQLYWSLPGSKAKAHIMRPDVVCPNCLALFLA